MRPSVGRIVHYRIGEDTVWAAIITLVEANGRVLLTAFPPGGGTQIVYGSDGSGVWEGDKVGQWSWPPRVP